MKTLFITITFLMSGVCLQAQSCNCKYKDYWKVGLNAAIFGAAQGQMDAFAFHPNAAARVWGTTTDNIDPAKTWTWKYKNNDVNQGYKNSLSRYIVIDPWHATKMIQNISYELMPVMMPQCKMTKQQKWVVPIATAVVKSIFFTLVYDGIYHK